ncbi:MAG: hypothetical protein QNL02_00025 [Paracoccaceae bacterium]
MLNGLTKFAALGLVGRARRASALLNAGSIEFEVATSDLQGFERS